MAEREIVLTVNEVDHTVTVKFEYEFVRGEAQTYWTPGSSSYVEFCGVKMVDCDPPNPFLKNMIDNTETFQEMLWEEHKDSIEEEAHEDAISDYYDRADYDYESRRYG